jgi:hypothetical protein
VGATGILIAASLYEDILMCFLIWFVQISGYRKQPITRVGWRKVLR